jgi:hypothetical protein
MLIKRILLSVLSVSFLLSQCYAEPILDKFKNRFYIGLRGGYGSTTWQGLVPSEENENDAMLLSTPTSVTEGGGVWGVFTGYEIIPCFAVEANYMRYPDAHINFDPLSLISFENDGLTELTSHTEAMALMAKFMLFLPHTTVRAFSSAGIAEVHRWDLLNDCWRLSPTFGVGFNYNFTDHIMSELAFNYTGGYGESEINPSKDYVPFLYSIFLGLAYRM